MSLVLEIRSIFYIPLSEQFIKLPGFVTPQESFYTGLEVTNQPNPHILTIFITGSVSLLTAVGSYTFIWYYLKTYHNTRDSISVNLGKTPE